MIKNYFVIFVSVLIISSCAIQSQNPPKTQMYTAHNIWKHPGMLYCINYKDGHNIIPAGTPVKDVEIIENKYPQSIEFRLANTNQEIRIYYTAKWHPGQTVESYAAKMFTPKNFTEATQAFNSEEIKSINQGILTVGMSKEAVLMSYGPPPEHYTSSLSNERWYYWMSKFKNKKICFDKNNRTIRCDDLEPEEL